MSRYRVPDHLICLGEGGNEVGETFMSQDWILEEVIRDDPRGDADAPDEDRHPLHAFFVDTDKSTLSSDLEDNIASDVADIADEYEIQHHPDVDGTVINVAQGPHERYLQPEQVTADATIKKLAEDLGLTAWWLEDDSENGILSPLDGLTRGGVDRKRGLTKAIYRISEWQSDPLDVIEQSVATQDESHVAMVVGIGGGTGSGLYLDLACRIKEAGATLTLFGILPTPSGRDDNSVLANAYAALSELEYLALADENYFRNIVLLPYDPAVDDDVFDKAATYTITSYYNISGAQTNTYTKFDETADMDGPPQYAPFTIGTTRYLHYLREDIVETRDNVDDYTDDIDDALDAERKLYDRLESYVETYHPDASKQLYTTDEIASIRLPSGDAVALSERLETVYTLLEQDFLEEIEFWSAGKLATAYEDIKATSTDHAEWEDESDKAAAIARDFISRLANNVDDVDTYEPDEGWTANEREFVELIIREFELVARRAGIVRALNAIRESDDTDETDAVAIDIKNALDDENSGYAAEVENLKKAQEAEKSSLEGELDTLETLVDEAGERATEISEQWREDVETAVAKYYSLYEKHERITTLLEDLKTEIKRQIDGLATKREASNVTVQGTEFESYGELNRLLKEVGCARVDESVIEQSVRATKKARKKQLQAQARSGSVRETVLGLIGWGTIGGLQGDYSTLRNQEVSNQLVRLSEWSEEFEASLRDEYFQDRLTSLETREEDLLNQIADGTQTAIETATSARENPDQLVDDDEARTLVENHDFNGVDVDQTAVTAHFDASKDKSLEKGSKYKTLEKASTAEEFLDLLEEGPVESVLSSVLVGPFMDRQEAIRNDLTAIEEQLEAYRTLKTIVTNEGSTYASKADDVDSVDSISIFEEASSQDPFKMEMRPKSRGRLGNSGDLGDTKLWDEKEEREKLLDSLTDLLPELGDEYLPVNERYIADSDTCQVDYDGYRLGSAFMSPLFEDFRDDQTAKIPALTDRLMDNRQFVEREYLTARGAFADDYDFALTTFLSGVFLDNLRLFTEECRDAYTGGTDVQAATDRHNTLQSVPNIVQHHTYGLDGVVYHGGEQFLPVASDGGFCYRRDLLNFNADGAKVLLDQAEDADANETQVVEALLEDHYEVVGYPSTVDLG